jgi:hypothetical protein
MLPPPRRPTAVNLDTLGIAPINWKALWALDTPTEEWSIPQILPRGKEGAIFGEPGVGKSLVLFDVAAAKATGRSVLGTDPADPVSVVYIDQEMTQGDLQERLVDFGFCPDDDLSNLHYYQLQMLPPLDTLEGGVVLMAIVERHQPELVILDTMTTLTEGKESSSDTYRAFHRNTAMRLKAAGVSLLRIDHQGKDASKGQRGSSAKADEADVVWRLSANEHRFVLANTKRRAPYIASNVTITRQREPLRHVLALSALPPGTIDTARLLDTLGVPMDATVAVASQTLQSSDQGRRKAVVAAALKLRRGDTVVVPGTSGAKVAQNAPVPRAELSLRNDVKPQVDSGISGSRNQREPREPSPEVNGSQVSPLIGGTRTGPELAPSAECLLNSERVGMTDDEAVAAVVLVFPGAVLVSG